MLSLVVSPTLTGQTQPSGTVRGLVQDAAGHPVTASTVRLQASSGTQTVQTDAQGAYCFTAREGTGYLLRADKAGIGEVTFGPFAVRPRETKKIDLALHSTKPAPSAEFYDEPQFTVAGVTDTAAPGGHGSDTVLRTSEAIAKDVTSLNKEPRASLSAEEEGSLKTLADREPANFDANHRLGNLLADSGRPQEAILYLERAAQLKAGDYRNAYELARACADAGQYERARASARALLNGHDTPELHHLLADVQEKLGEPVAAVREYQRAAELSPTESNLFDWGAELLVHRALQPAIEVYGKGSRLFPNSSRMLIGLSVSWYAAGSYEQAVESLCRAADVKPDDPTPYLFLGKLQSVNASHSEAVAQHLGRFAELQPSNALANYYYAVSLRDRRNGRQDDGAKTEALLNQAIRLDPTLAAGHLQLGILYEDRKDFPKAMFAYQRAIDLAPQMEEGHFRLAQVYRQTGEKQKAQQELRLFEQMSKKSAEKADRQRRELPQFVYTLRGPSQ